MRKSGGRGRGAVAFQFTDICAVLVSGLAIAACLRRGLFFAEEWYPVLTVWFLLCGAAAASRIGVGDKRGHSDLPVRVDMPRASVQGMTIQHKTGTWTMPDGIRAAETGTMSADGHLAETWKHHAAVSLMLGGPVILTVLYAVAWARGPLSAQGTLNELLRWSGYGCFAMLAWAAAPGVNASRLLSAVWHAAGLILALSALLSFYGGLPVPFAVFYSASPEVSVSGARLGGLLQYPNAFGAAMAVFLLERLFAVAHGYASGGGTGTGRKRENRRIVDSGRMGNGGASRWKDREAGGRKGRGVRQGQEIGQAPGVKQRVPGGLRFKGDRHLRGGMRHQMADCRPRGELLRLAPLFPYAAALLLSESRGAWLAAACAAAAALPLQRRLALPLLAAGAAPLAAALLCRGLAPLPAALLPGLPLLAGLWAGALAAGLWLGRRVRHAGGRGRAAALTLAALAWTAGGAAVLPVLLARGTGPSSTVAARGLMYRDALRLAAETPWLGRGGETWRSAYLAVQSRPYVGSQVHSGYLDLLLNTGVIGVTAAAISLAAAGWLINAHSRRLLPPFLVIALHGAVDLDWSYGLFWLLLFWLPALARAEADSAKRLSAQRRSRSCPPAISPSERVTVLLTAKRILANHLPAKRLTIRRTSEDHSRAKYLILRQMPSGHLPATTLNSGLMPTNDVSAKRPYPADPRNQKLAPPGLRLLARRLAAVWACCLLLALSLISFRAYRGEALYRAAASARNGTEALALLNRSIAWNPLSPKSALALSSLLKPERRIEILTFGLRHSPGNPALNWAMAEAALDNALPGEALYWLRRAQSVDIFNDVKRTKAVQEMLALGQRKLAEGETREALRCAEAGRELLRQYLLLAAEAGTGGRNDRDFRFTTEARELGERLEALKREASGLEEQRKVAEAYIFKRR